MTMAAFNHAAVPFLGKAKPLAQMASRADARAYAAAGYHVCVDQNAKAGVGTSRAAAWQAAGGAYARAYFAATTDVAGMALPAIGTMLRAADAQATSAAALTPVASNGGGASPVHVDPTSAVPPAEQVEQQTGGGGIGDMQIGGMPLWALAIPLAYFAYKKFGKKGGRRRRR
jgi:hypothetical protein